MASSSSLRRCLQLAAALLCVAAPRCMSDRSPDGIVVRALECFNDRQVYSACQASYRLSAQGAIDVPYEATDAYCGGPCLAETDHLLNCIDDILYNFRFYNGASVRDVRYTLRRGCGHGRRRGDFDVRERMKEVGYGGFYGGDYEGDYYFYDGGNMLGSSVVVTLAFCAILLLGNV